MLQHVQGGGQRHVRVLQREQGGPVCVMRAAWPELFCAHLCPWHFAMCQSRRP